MAKTTTKQPDLEKSLSDITALIEKMEHGELTLEQSLAEFEKGITLIKHCQQVLNEAEQRVTILIEKNGQANLSPYSKETDEDASE